MAKVHIYACGGAGTNIIQNSLDLNDYLEMPEIDISIIDTSRSNVRINLEKENIGHTFVDGLTGGGKDQRLVFDAARPYVIDHLNKNKPGDFNIVLMSLSGASGAATGALIVDELLSRKAPLIVFAIGSTEDGKQTENTFNCLRTLQNLSKKNGSNITIAYHENTYGGENDRRIGSETYVNTAIRVGVRDICRLVSEKHIGLDREDIRNWLYPKKVKDAKPTLVELFTSADHDTMSHVSGRVIASASLLANQDSSVPKLMQPYSCKGYVSEALLAELGDDFDGFHYLIIKGFIKGTYNRILSVKNDYETASKKMFEEDDDIDGDFPMEDNGDDPFVF